MGWPALTSPPALMTSPWHHARPTPTGPPVPWRRRYRLIPWLPQPGGGRHRRGAQKEHFRKASKGIIRHILQQLAEIDIVAKKEDKSGRWITTNGQRELDTIANEVCNPEEE